MKENQFENIWKHHFSKIIENFVKNTDHVSIKDGNVHSLKKDILLKYEYYRQEYKKAKFPNKESKIDRHKVAAIFVIAFIHSQPIKSNIVPQGNLLYGIEYFPNEILSIKCALILLKLFIVGEFKRHNRPNEHIDRFSKTKWKFPKCKLSEGEYLINLIRDLYATRIHSKSDNFSYLIPYLSHIFFFLEYFHLSKFEN